MQVQKALALRGPHLWFSAPALEVWVETCEDDTPTELGPAFAWLQRVIPETLDCQTLRHPAALLQHLLLGLQKAAGVQVERTCLAPTSNPRVARVIVQYEDEPVARQALERALALFEVVRGNADVDFDAEARALTSFHQQFTLGPSTRSIVRAAKRRGIPFRRLTSGSMVQFGYGKNQRRIQAAETDETGAIAQEIAQDKELTRTLLRAVGVPVTDGQTVESAEHAWEVAQEIGPPVVVKPQDGNQGRGVATNLSTRAQVMAAYEAAQAESPRGRVIVESFAPGDDYRVLVVGNQMVAAARREPAQVLADGIHTVFDLVEQVNQDPRRGEDHATSLSKIALDSVSQAVLAEQGLTPASVPPAGARVLIRRNANLSTGGTACDVTDRVHPEVAQRCIEAARMIGLDIAGVDVIAADIAQPLEAQSGVIVEVNAAPGLRMHLEPSQGTPRPVGEAIMELLYPHGATGRIPIAAVTGVNGKTTVTRFLAAILREAGSSVGMSCTDGIYINDRRIDRGDCSGPASAQAVLMNPAIEVAVLETARGGILRAGLGFDQCDVAIVTNIGSGDHLGLSDVRTPEDLARVKGLIVANLAPTGCAVLNAADPLVAGLAERTAAPIIYFAYDADEPVLVDHRARGGRAVFVRHGEIVMVQGAREIGLSRLNDVSITHGGRIGFQVENTLAAAAGAWALGLDIDPIRKGVETFGAEAESLPGRFNLFEIHGATVIVDYGHNTSALQAMMDAVLPLPCRSRSIVYSAAGDRRDEDMIEQGAILSRHFDSVVLYEDRYRRGRDPGEIVALFRRGLEQGGRVRRIDDCQGALRAVETALKRLAPGDLLVVQADTIDDTVEFVRRYLAAAEDGRELNTLEEVEALAYARPSKRAALDAD